MIKKSHTLILIWLCFSIISCNLYLRKNEEFSDDYKTMNKMEFASKYYTLFKDKTTDLSKVDVEKVYYTLRNNSTFQYHIFSSDSFVYDTPIFSIENLGKSFKPIKLNRSAYFYVSNDTIKIERIAQNPGNVYTIIEEGVIKNDSIILKKQYNSKGMKNRRNLFDIYILTPEIIIYKMGNDYFLEKKKS